MVVRRAGACGRVEGMASVSGRSQRLLAAHGKGARGRGAGLACGAGGRARQVTSSSSLGFLDSSTPSSTYGEENNILAAVGLFEEEVERNFSAELQSIQKMEQEKRKQAEEVNRMITEAPDAYAVCHVAKTHWRSFDATATTRAIAWLAKFSSTLQGTSGVQEASDAEAESLVAIAGEAVKRLRSLVEKHCADFSRRDLIVLLGGFAQLNWGLEPSLADRVRALVESSQLEKLRPQELVCAVWALGKSNGKSFLSKKSLERLELNCLRQLAGGALETPQMVQVVWGFGQLSHRLTCHEWYEGIKKFHGADSLKSLQPSEQTLFAWSLSRVGLCNDKALGKTLLAVFKSSLRQYDLVSMNTMLKCFHLMRVRVSSDLLAKCEVRCLQCMSKCSTEAISDFIYRCVKTKHKVSVHTSVYAENTVNSKIDQLSAKDMALLMWSFAKLGHKPKATFLKRLENQFELLEMKPQSLSLLIWAYAKLRLPTSKRFADAHYYMVWKDLAGMNMQCLANIMWSYGRLRLDVPNDLHAELMDHFRLHISECNSQNISNIMVSCARLGKAVDGDLLSRVEQVSSRSMAKFSSQGMSNVLWSFIKLNHRPSQDYLVSFQKHFGASIHKASPQNIANVVWSFAQIRYTPYESLMQSLFDKVDSKLDTFSEQDVATLLWGCGKLKYRIPTALAYKFQTFCLARQRKFSLHDISLSLWGFTQQPTEIRPEVLQAMYEASMRHLDRNFHAEAFVHVVWSLSVRSTGGLNRGAVLAERYEGDLLETVQSLSGYDSSKLLCSLSFLGCMKPEICSSLMRTIESRIHTYDVQQLQSILNAVEALDPDVLGELDCFAFNMKLNEAIKSRYASSSQQQQKKQKH
ncbi:FAST kinase-like domain-containing protein [Chloropicon primus]|uniref:FAST kinase leucine-rich domain-containing protein n=1 Tax=Chloropicon primus TaxID=1764295 RepID=A0A5B8MM47_9CHLO|nr:hypothetical protein A3770_06p41240 [Chloropicon primus]UPR00817.1 FAST kinase-like domain-containing protein [Chloropicon primus]|eukprot:QDZ21606.1 hypothetical protein A3770_06p41240 [Chloropicon primus]